MKRSLLSLDSSFVTWRCRRRNRARSRTLMWPRQTIHLGEVGEDPGMGGALYGLPWSRGSIECVQGSMSTFLFGIVLTPHCVLRRTRVGATMLSSSFCSLPICTPRIYYMTSHSDLCFRIDIIPHTFLCVRLPELLFLSINCRPDNASSRLFSLH